MGWNTGRHRAVVIAGIGSLALAAWMIIDQPWQREVWVTTTMDAFVGPAPGTSAIWVSESEIHLAVGITPAPWPEEAHTIYSAARRGKRVHVTVRTGKEALRFDVDGVTSGGDLRIVCATAQEANRLASALRLL